jgi:glycosyltransferase involved in cell wall biosynthesis
MSKIKVVWLCHFVNQEMKEYFNMPAVNSFAPWIDLLINLFKSNQEIELHILAPNLFTNSDYDFTKDGINYHFYKFTPVPLNNDYLRKILFFLKFNDRSNYSWIKNKITKKVNSINPDLIHLFGAENPYYSSGIIPLFKVYPVLLTIQGFIRKTSFNTPSIRKRIKIEELIIRNVKNIGIRTEEMKKDVLSLNRDAIFHIHNLPIKKPGVIKNNIGAHEPIDCIFFSRISKDKGIEDLLAAIAIVKHKLPNVSLHIIGSAPKSYLDFLMQKCRELNIENNVLFLGFLPAQSDIYKHAFEAKICVLPTYHDIIPGTIIESMFMKLPVIAYAVGGIPELNNNEETVVLVEKQNISQLAENILHLINNAELRVKLSEKGYKHANKMFDNNNIAKDLLHAYKSVISQ